MPIKSRLKYFGPRNFFSETKKNKEGNTKSRKVKIKTVGVNQTLITILQKTARSKKKRFQDVTTKPTKDTQTNKRPTILFETE